MSAKRGSKATRRSNAANANANAANANAANRANGSATRAAGAASGSDGVRARPTYGAHHRSDDANAFMPDPEDGPARIRDDLAENLAEDYLQAATQGMEVEEDHDQIVPEELGGPFVETSAAEEFALDTDEANPEDASREPLPRPVAGLVMSGSEDEDNE